MQVKIIETGAQESICAIDASTGCDYTIDLIGNTGALSNGQFKKIEDTGIYLCSQSEFEWWATVIADYNAASVAIEEAKNLGLWTDEQRADYYAIECNDMDSHAAACRDFAKSIIDAAK